MIGTVVLVLVRDPSGTIQGGTGLKSGDALPGVVLFLVNAVILLTGRTVTPDPPIGTTVFSMGVQLHRSASKLAVLRQGT